MYEAFYKLANDPFRLLPDPDICFPHRSCAKAWAYLRYALKRGEGIVVVTGPPGSGKTTLAERLLNELNPSKTVSVKLIANDLNPTDLLRKLAYSFGLPAEGMDRAMLAHRIERYLIELEHGNRQALVLIDEAQTLSHQSLEAMRLLTDLQSRSRPVLQLFLLGQEDLEGVMCAPGMTQFQQRVIASCRLHRMDLPETKAYLEYRLGFADWSGDPSINGPAVMAIFRASRGLPRHVNKICSRLLLHGCTEEKHVLKQRDVIAVVNDLRDELLTPMDGEPESMVEIAGSAGGSVYELALVPTPRAPVAAKQTSHDAMGALFLAEEPTVPPNPGAGYRAQNVDGVARPRRAAGRHFYRVGHPPPYRFRRWLHRAMQLPLVLAGRVSEGLRKWAPVVAEQMARIARRVTVSVARLAKVVSRWAGGRTCLPGVSNGRMQSLPNGVVAGLGGLLLAGLAFATWHINAGPQQSLAADSNPADGFGRTPFLLGEADPAEASILVGARGYLDAGRIAPMRGGAISTLLNSAGDLAQEMARFDPMAYRSGLVGDAGQELLGKVTDAAAARVVDRVAQAASTLDVWALANNVPEAEREDAPDGYTTVATAVIGPPVAVASDGTNALRAPGDEGESGSRGRAMDRQDTDEKITLIVTDEAGMSLDVVNIFPLSTTGAPLTEPPAEAEPGAVEASSEASASASATLVSLSPTASDHDMVVLNVAEDNASDQDAVDDTARRQREIEHALALAELAMKKDRLLMPAGDSAYGHYQRVLAIDARNEEAHTGLRRIVWRYGTLAQVALDKQAFDKAERYLGRGLRVDPDNARLLALRVDLNDAIAEAEAAELEAAELARMALEMARPKPIVEPEPRQETSLNDLMRSIDGL